LPIGTVVEAEGLPAGDFVVEAREVDHVFPDAHVKQAFSPGYAWP
jgi:hypothetical protein